MTQIKENITPEFFNHGEQKYRSTPPTKEEEAQWKATFGEVLVADDGEGHKLWLRRPDLAIMRVAIAQFRKGKTTIDFEDLLFKSCWLAGNEAWLTNEDLYEAALNELEPWLEIPDAETRFLADLLEPTIGLVTNNGKDHLGEYGSFENVIKANKELYDFFEEKGE